MGQSLPNTPHENKSLKQHVLLLQSQINFRRTRTSGDCFGHIENKKQDAHFNYQKTPNQILILQIIIIILLRGVYGYICDGSLADYLIRKNEPHALGRMKPN